MAEEFGTWEAFVRLHEERDSSVKTYNPSRYQGLIREKSVLWDSLGSLLRWEKTNYSEYEQFVVDHREVIESHLNMVPVLHRQCIHLVHY